MTCDVQSSLSDRVICLYESLLRLLSRHCLLHINSLPPFQHFVLWVGELGELQSMCHISVPDNTYVLEIKRRGSWKTTGNEKGKYVNFFFFLLVECNYC